MCCVLVQISFGIFTIFYTIFYGRLLFLALYLTGNSNVFFKAPQSELAFLVF